jgi:putative ABC transport system substrate-binding protein
MRRREFIALVGGAVATFPLAARAQQPAMPVLGVLTAARLADNQRLAVTQGLSETGFSEGRNLTVIERGAEGQFDRLPALAAELVSRQVNVILALGSPVPARAAKAATQTIPIVFGYGGDPVRDNLVTSLNRPSGNVTGVTFISATLAAKRLELLREIAPGITDIALLVNPNNELAESQTQDAESAARALGLRIHVVKAADEREIDEAFASIIQRKFSAILVGTDPGYNLRRFQLTALAARHALPTIFAVREYATAGGLISYGASIADSWRQAGNYVGKILNGAKPADLPVVQPTRYELVINLKTAKALGLSVPLTLQVAADEVIE